MGEEYRDARVQYFVSICIDILIASVRYPRYYLDIRRSKRDREKKEREREGRRREKGEERREKEIRRGTSLE